MPQPANTPIVAVEALGRIARVLERLPGALEELAVLRIHDRGFFGTETEELGIESSEVLQRAVRSDEGRIGEQRLGHTIGAQLVVGEVAHALDAVTDIAPELVGVGRAGEPAGHADDSDVVRAPVIVVDVDVVVCALG